MEFRTKQIITDESENETVLEESESESNSSLEKSSDDVIGFVLPPQIPDGLSPSITQVSPIVEGEKKKRGRKPGIKYEKQESIKKNEIVSFDRNSLIFQIRTIHKGMGLLLNPIFELNDDECASLADSILEVIKQYDLTLIDAKTASLINLATNAAIIYGIRLHLFNKIRMENAKALKNAQQNAKKAKESIKEETEKEDKNIPLSHLSLDEIANAATIN
jgi:hypothetical protein